MRVMKAYIPKSYRGYSSMQESEGLNKFRGAKKFIGSVGNAIEHTGDVVIKQCDAIDRDLTSTWKYWQFRMGRIFPPNFVLHVNSIISLVLNVMQVLLIIEFIRKTNGNFDDVNTFVIMLPTYIQLSLKLLVQLAALVMVTENVLQKEKKHTIFVMYEELHSCLPVFEHVVPVITYIMFLLCAISIGGCHLNWGERAENTTFCKNMNLSAVEGIICTAMAGHMIHHILAIYNHYRHTASLQKKWCLDEDNSIEMNHLKPRNMMTELESISTELSQSMDWWKFRMSRIFSANLTNNIFKAADNLLEGTQIILLVRAFHVAKGNLNSVPNWSEVLLPLQICFFLKMTVVLVMLIWVSYRTCQRESKMKVLRLLSEPKGWIQIAEHILPFVVFLMFGLTSSLAGRCMVNADQHAICKLFSWSAVESVIMLAAIVMFLYHIKAIHNVHMHGSKWETKKEKYKIDLNDTASSVN